MPAGYTAVIQQDGPWWIGWIEEVPGVNSQGKTRDELIENLRDALDEALQMNGTAAGGVVIQALESSGNDSLVDELLQSNAAFQALVAKSKASPRKPFGVTGTEH